MNYLAWEQLFKSHIQTVVKHYKGKVTSWDVANEIFDNNGKPRLDAQNKKFINIRARHLWKDYLARAFIYAHEGNFDQTDIYQNKSELLDKIYSSLYQCLEA